MSDNTDLSIDPKCKTVLPYAETALRRRVFESIGAASTCWESLDMTGVFDSTRAAEIGERLVADLLEITNLGKPSLGCATTRELALELETRIRLGHGHADYKTVQG